MGLSGVFTDLDTLPKSRYSSKEPRSDKRAGLTATLCLHSDYSLAVNIETGVEDASWDTALMADQTPFWYVAE